MMLAPLACVSVAGHDASTAIYCKIFQGELWTVLDGTVLYENLETEAESTECERDNEEGQEEGGRREKEREKKIERE